MKRWVGRVAAALFGLAIAAIPGAVRAESTDPPPASRAPAAPAKEARPYDAPRIDADHIAVPHVPEVYRTDEDAGIVISYQPSTGERVHLLAGRIAAIRAELSAELGVPVLAHVEIRVAAAPSEMARLAPVEQIPSYAPAVAFSEAHLVVISAASPLSSEQLDMEPWIRHELAHLALDEAINNQPIPRWLHEGYALQFAGDDTAVRAEVLSSALLRRRIVDLDAIEPIFPAEPQQGSIAAAEAADFARFLASPPNRDRFTGALARARAGEPFAAALEASFGESFTRIEGRWRREIARRYSFVPVFLATSVLWMLIAAAVLMRRARARRALSDAPRHRGVEVSRRAVLAGRRTQSAGLRRARGTRVLDDEIPEGAPIPPEPEVPKVEHDGRWYTLH